MKSIRAITFPLIVSLLLFSTPSASFAATPTPPTATIVVPSSDIATTTNAVVSFSGATTTTALPAGTVVGNYTVGNSPSAVAFDSYTNSIWVTNSYDWSVTKINAVTGGVIGTYPTTVNDGSYIHGPSAIAFDPVTNSVWIANYDASNVTRIDVTTGMITATSTVGISSPSGVAFDPYNKAIWVTNAGNATVTKIDIASGTDTNYTLQVGSAPDAIAFDPSTKSVWIVDPATSNIFKISVIDGTIKGTYVDNNRPSAIAFDSADSSIWITNYGDSSVTEITAALGALIKNYQNPDTSGNTSSPTSIAFDPVTNSVWVTESTGSTVLNINPVSSVQTDYYTGQNYPLAAAFDPVTNSVWVANCDSSTVTQMSTGANPTIIAYEWRENACDTTGTLLSTAPSFDFSSPAVGSYPIYFRVEDSQGLWSTSGPSCPTRTVKVTSSPAPTATLYANGKTSTTIVSGNSATLTWSSSNASSCDFIVSPPSTGPGHAANNSTGVSTGVLSSTQNYQLSCTGPGGSADSNIATVTVVNPAVTITANPARVPSVNAPNNRTTLAWSTNDPSHTTSCSVLGGNGFSASGISNSGIDSGPITDQTVFLINCQMTDSPNIYSSVIVNIAPNFQSF
ncbi:MAG: hypothetical protein ACYC75_01495 [Minisyncoccota bacterium]